HSRVATAAKHHCPCRPSDATMPRADPTSASNLESNPVPTQTNPIGAKGACEAGNVGALPAVANALFDALSPLGIRHLEMPATPERIWRAIQAARVSDLSGH